MDNVVETLSVSLSLIALFLIVIVVVFNLYLIKRNGFYVSVNCWFCNNWTKVLYKNRNSFDCPFCLQYNGFNEEGGYNKVIKAQYDTTCNRTNNSKKTEVSANGLCNYCNNNQQLKIYQLANFVPLKENNYDIEVEHFRAQLEKSYKLCKKCDKILKTTIEKQHAWIFGNRLKDIRKKGLSLIDLNKSSQGISKEVKQSFILSVTRYTLILFALLILCQTLDVKVQYPAEKVKKIIPDAFVPYIMLINEVYSMSSRTLNDDINKLNAFLPTNIKFRYHNLLPISYVGFLLEIILAIFGRQSKSWKVNELLGWVVLVITSSFSFHNKYFVYVNTVQVLSSIIVIYSYLRAKIPKEKKQSRKKKYEFKKLRRNVESTSDISDSEDTVENTSSSSSSKQSKSGSLRSKQDLIHAHSQSPCVSSVKNFCLQNNHRNTANLNESFTTAKSNNTASVFNGSYKNVSNDSSNSELRRSLDNLHLSNLNFKMQPSTSPVFSTRTVNRPILSPPKLKNITQNSWTAGGFWKNDGTVFSASPDFTNLSRSSSQTSGFVSNNDPVDLNPFMSLPATREPSACRDYERTSVLSEPAYHFKPINTDCLNSSQLRNSIIYNSPQSSRLSLSPTSSQLYYRAENNTFYPLLNQNNMLFIQGGNIPPHSVESNFGNLSLKSFNANSNNFNSQILFSERPVASSLFKNLSTINTAAYSCGIPQC